MERTTQEKQTGEGSALATVLKLCQVQRRRGVQGRGLYLTPASSDYTAVSGAEGRNNIIMDVLDVWGRIVRGRTFSPFSLSFFFG